MQPNQNLIQNYHTQIFNKLIHINLKPVFYPFNHVLPLMNKHPQPYILNTSSLPAIRPLPNHIAYPPTKHP
ncbi:SDR family NAD(P)-dependent oxidoreductase, partial [Paenibacillus xylanexedens]|uniref:SDR family NAD(P)-dependent oxidoreductase n=1 Tax=Paenibacillus xylanexedens TaxID=528191 RepID=UPI0034D95247